MKTKVEINGYEIEIEENDGIVTVKAEKDGEIVEEFTLETGEGSEDEEGQEEGQGGIKSFDDFDEEGQEEEDFDEEGQKEESEEEEELQDEEEESEEEEEEESKLESFQSFINKTSKKK